jgi:hypothetical protein
MFFSLICVSAKVFIVNTSDLDWITAVSGFSPIDWINHIKDTRGFTKDFPQGLALYGSSFFMNIYSVADTFFKIKPEEMMHLVICLEILLMVCASIIFFRALIPNFNPIAALVFAILVINSGARSSELGGFGGPFFAGLHYNFADGMRLIGIALFFRQRFLLAALVFGLSIMTHPVMGLMGVVFVAGFVMSDFYSFKWKKIIFPAIIFILFVVGWWLYQFPKFDIAASNISPDIWISFTKMFSYHFYPIANGILTFDFERRFLPFLCLLILAYFYIFKVNISEHTRRGVLVGGAFLLVLTVLGLGISYWSNNPVLIKLALMRASDVLILVCLCIIVAGLISSLQSAHILSASIAGALLVSPFLGPPFPVVYVFLIVLLDLPFFQGGKGRAAYIGSLGLLIALGLLILTYYKLGFVSGSYRTTYLGSQYLWQFALCIGIGGGLISFIRKSKSDFTIYCLPLVLIAMIYAAWGWRATVNHGPEEKSAGLAFMNAQLWAKDNSPSGALFMVDPTIYYGWRDFSQRSSFGNMREWLHTSWLYDSNRTNYDEGMRRAEEFGLSPFNYLNESPPILGYEKMDRDIRAAFYSFDENWFLNMSHKYGINYVVMRKKYIQKFLKFEKDYENDFIIIYKIPA